MISAVSLSQILRCIVPARADKVIDAVSEVIIVCKPPVIDWSGQCSVEKDNRKRLVSDIEERKVPISVDKVNLHETGNLGSDRFSSHTRNIKCSTRTQTDENNLAGNSENICVSYLEN